MNDPRAPDLDYADRASAVPAMVSRLKIDGYECRFSHPLNPFLGQFGNPFENFVFLQLPPRHDHPQHP